MLGKALLTIAVIAIAFLVLRRRHDADTALREGSEGGKDKSGRQSTSSAKESIANDLRMGAYLFLALMVGIGAALYYARWQDDHTVLTITLHRDDAAAPITYQVYKYQLGERSFTTVDGTTVTVAGSERMEIEGLAD